MVEIEGLRFLHLCGICGFSVHHLEFGSLFCFNYCSVFLIPGVGTDLAADTDSLVSTFNPPTHD